MVKFESAEIPFKIYDKKTVLTGQQLAEDRYLNNFVERFKDCFEYDFSCDFYVFTPPLQTEEPSQTTEATQ